jgi:hypothetical protein
MDAAANACWAGDAASDSRNQSGRRSDVTRARTPGNFLPGASRFNAQLSKGTFMSIGGGIALIVIGLIFVLNVVQVDIPWINEYALGLILILGGVAAILLSLTVWRGRGTRVIERRVEPGVDDRTL